VAEEAVKRSRAHVDLARARREAGTALRFDVLKAETEQADADLLLVRSRGAARVARGRLCQAMGLRVSEAFEIEALPGDAGRGDLADVDRLLDEAARARPELLALGARIEARRADLRAVESEYFPAVSAAADYGWRDPDHAPRREEWAVGVGLSFPLFEGFATRYRAGRARAELARASADRESALRGIELEVWAAHSRVREAAEAVEAASKFAQSAEESARVAEGMYRGGTGSIIELVDSLAARTEARTRLVQATLDLHSARARFERSVGKALR
jgi:outer membrane protein